MKELCWRIKHEIESKILKLSLFGDLERDEAERRAIAEVAASEKAKHRARPDAAWSALDLFAVEPPVFTNPDPGPAFWRAKAAEFTAMMMRPLSRVPAPPPAALAPIAAPRPTARKQRTATGAPKLTTPTRPVEPPSPVRLVYVSGARTALDITSEFRNSPATEAWRATARGHL
jgi:hypothetical protein